MKLTTWASANAKMSVLVNGLFIPFKEAPGLMQRYVRPALFSTGDSRYELQFAGTALMARFREWNFALVTAHQAQGKAFETSTGAFVVVIDSGAKRLAVPPTSAHVPKFESEDHRTLEDLIYFGYDREGGAVKPQHLDLKDVLWSDSDVGADYSFVIGYPTQSVRIELGGEDGIEITDFKLGWIRQDLVQSDRRPMDTENRSIFVKHPKSNRLSIEPDGLSGSPVFSMVRLGTDRRLRFDGIVTNANGDRFAVYPSVHIRDALEDITMRREPLASAPLTAP
jgi:hypothetical protein